MRVIYDKEADVLRMITGHPIADTASFLRGPDVAVDLSTKNGHDVVGLTVIGASAYIPLAKGYDAEEDTLTIGETTSDPALVTDSGDFIGYWNVCIDEFGDFMDPVGVLIRDASKHLSPVIGGLSA